MSVLQSSKELLGYLRTVSGESGESHDTQRMATVYRQRVIDHHPNGVIVANTMRRRHLLTTRNDGHIHFTVQQNGDFRIETEYNA